MERWAGKVAIVTGASSGIGEAIAKCLVNEGLQVIGLARRIHLLNTLSSTLATSKGTFHPYPCDISSEESILSAFTFAKTIGPIHILINNAGIILPGNLHDGDLELWKRSFDVNVLGLCVATREAARDMRKNNVDGHIVNINSTAGHEGNNAPFNIYSATKFAVRGLTETLRMELRASGSKVKVTSVSPGYVETEIFDSEGLLQVKECLKNLPKLTCKDVADAVLFVLGTPKHVQVEELIIKPVGYPF